MIGVPSWIGFPLTPMFFGLPDLRGHSALPIDATSSTCSSSSRSAA